MEPQTGFAIAGDKLFLRGELQIANGAVAVADEFRRMLGANAMQEGWRVRGKEGRSFFGAKGSKAARLVELAGGLGEKFVGGQADRDGNADIAFDLEGKACQCHCRRRLVDFAGARQIEIGFVDGDDLHERGERAHFLADLARCDLVFFIFR